MSSFGFELVLFLNDFNTLEISPPSSLFNLREIASEKFNTTKLELCYENEKHDKVDLKDESDYFQMFNFVAENKMKEIVVYLNPHEILKKKKATRKNSRANKPSDVFGGGNYNDDGTCDYYDPENDKDLRNLKANDTLEEGIKYSKHGYNKKNQARIYYIKEKKEMQREEQQEKEEARLERKKKLEEEERIQKDLDFGKKNKNKIGSKAK